MAEENNNNNEDVDVLRVFKTLESVGFRFIDYHETDIVYLCESGDISYIIPSQESFALFKYIIFRPTRNSSGIMMPCCFFLLRPCHLSKPHGRPIEYADQNRVSRAFLCLYAVFDIYKIVLKT